MRATWLLATVVGMGALFAIGEREARACGGCFHEDPPPGPTPRPPSVVTDHRMIVSISQQQTTLYDELRYSGEPTSFAWVLPTAGLVTIGISSDGLFATLDAMTQVNIVPPPQNCPQPPVSCQQAASEDVPNAAGGSADGGAAFGGVTVTAQQTIGPYETVQLHATDGSNALPDWLTSHGYTIAEDVKPIINAYVAAHFDFLAMKLVPGTGIQAMRPVRVTSQGASAVLPLRMVAAGTGASVGVTLFTVAEGRYEPQNFPFFTIKADELVWDWTTSSSNFASLTSERAGALGGRGWQIESSAAFKTSAVPGYVTGGYCPPSYGGGRGGGGGFGGGGGASYACSGAQNDYEAEDGGPDASSLTKQEVQTEDLNTLLAGIGEDVRVTRARSALAHAALDQDLVLRASADQSELPTTLTVTKELNQPMCAVYQGCSVVGTAPRDEAWAKSDFSNHSNGTSSCGLAKPSARTGGSALLGFGALAGLVIVAAKRLRRRR